MTAAFTSRQSGRWSADTVGVPWRARGHPVQVLSGADQEERGVGGLPGGLRRGGRTSAPGGAPWVPGRSRAVFLDVDGTTLGSAPVASPAVVSAHAAAVAAGLQVFLATGRLPRGVRELQQQLDHDAPAVVHNGAAVVEGGRELRSWPLPGDAAHELGQWCLDAGQYVEFYSGAGMFVSDRRPEAQVTWHDISGPPDGSLPDLLASGAQVTKATIDVFDAARLPEVLEVVRALGLTAEPSTAPVLPGVPIVNVTAPGVTKGTAVAWLARARGVDVGRSLAVGDGDNDVSMFEVVGTSIAMGQAPDAVQEQAHLVAPPFAQDGLARVLELVALGEL